MKTSKAKSHRVAVDELESLVQKAQCWDRIVEQLREHNPVFDMGPRTVYSYVAQELDRLIELDSTLPRRRVGHE